MRTLWPVSTLVPVNVQAVLDSAVLTEDEVVHEDLDVRESSDERLRHLLDPYSVATVDGDCPARAQCAATRAGSRLHHAAVVLPRARIQARLRCRTNAYRRERQ
jgi:hypothetical protein